MVQRVINLISVIVPVYNVENYLQSCIKSLLNQSYKKLEIVLVDDGSTDSSGIICDSFRKKYKNIQVIHKKNGGLASARNVGIKYAKGDLIGFVDSDDTVSNRMYEVLLKNMITTKSDISICGRYYVLDNGEKKIRYKEKNKLYVMSSKDGIKRMNSFSSFDMAAWDKLYKKQLFNNVIFPEGKLSEDYFIMYKLFLESQRICYTPEPLYNYRQRENSISHSSSNINFDFIKAAKQQMQDVEKIYPDLTQKLHVAYASANMTVYDFHLKSKIACPKKTRKAMQANVKSNLSYIKNDQQLSFAKKFNPMYLFIIISCIILCLNVLRS